MLDSDKMSIACDSLPLTLVHLSSFCRERPLSGHPWSPHAPVIHRRNALPWLARVKAGPKSITLRLSSWTCFHHWPEDCSSRLPLTVECGVPPSQPTKSSYHPIPKEDDDDVCRIFHSDYDAKNAPPSPPGVVPPSHPQSLLFPPKSFP